jgi:hypothetical protein
MSNQNVAPVGQERQESALDNLSADLLAARREMVTSEVFHLSGLAAGKLVILIKHYQSGHRLRPRKLKRYLKLIAGEVA